jgi:ATF/CREB family transcription factor
MLQGPTTSSGGVGASSSLGFESHIRTGLTPNESGIRSGLTPGGSGSIFAQPQNTMFQFATSGGGTTPGTLEFHKTAISAVRKGLPGMSTSQHISVKPEDTSSGHNDHDQKSRQHSDPYHGSDPAHNAASGLFLLAQAQHQQGDSAAAPMVTSGTGYQNNSQLPSVMSGSNGGPIESPSPSLAKRAVVNSANNAAMSSSINRSASSVTSMANSIRASSEASDMSDSGEDMPMSSNNGSRNARGRKSKGASMNGRSKSQWRSFPEQEG